MRSRHRVRQVASVVAYDNVLRVISMKNRDDYNFDPCAFETTFDVNVNFRYVNCAKAMQRK